MTTKQSKLEKVTKELASRMEVSEMDHEDYNKFFHGLLYREGILKSTWGDYEAHTIVNAERSEYWKINQNISGKLKLTMDEGIKHTYIGLKEKFSEEALKDCKNYNILYKELEEHLKAKYGNEKTDAIKFGKEMMSYVDGFIKDMGVSGLRRNWISLDFYSNISTNFNLIGDTSDTGFLFGNKLVG